MLRTLFVLSILAVGISAGIRSRFAALVLYVWFALFRPEQWMWIDISFLRPSLMIGLLLVIPAFFSGIVPDASHPISVAMLVFLLSSFLAQINAVSQATGWNWIQDMVCLLLVSLLSVTLVTTRQRFVMMVSVVGASFGFHAAKAGLASMLGGGVRYYDGMVGAFVDNNGYALGAVMILPFLVAAAQNLEKRWMRLLLLSWVPLTMMLVVSTFSRGGALGMVTSVLVYVLLQRKKAFALIGLTVLVALAAAVVPIPKGYFDRVQTIQTYEDVGDESALGRLHFWGVATEMALKQPLGIGLRNFEATYDSYDFSNGAFGRARQVHSSHFEVLAENGWLGTGAWLFLFGYSFLVCIRVRSRSRTDRLAPEDQKFLFTTANCMIVSMSGFIVGGAFIALSLNDLTWLTFGLVAALDRLSIKMLAEAREPVPVPASTMFARPALPGFATANTRRYGYR